MISVQLSDFENYRSKLLEYALALLKSRGAGKVLFAECDEKAKDIVQETYLAFHSSSLDCFVNELHLWNFLKLCLYHKYQESIDHRRKSIQYNLFKQGNLDYIDNDLEDVGDNKNDKFTQLKSKTIDTYSYDNYIDEFLKSLTDYQHKLVNKLLDGFKPSEIATELNISRQGVDDSLQRIRKKYKEYENTSS